MAAAITFYLLFMFGPMLALELRLADVIFSEGEFKDQVVELFPRAVGEEGGEAVEDLLSEFKLPRSGGIEIFVGCWMMIFGGVNAMGQARQSISGLWGLDESDHRNSGWRQASVDLSFTLGLALLLIASVMIHSIWYIARDAMDAGGWLSFTFAGSLYFTVSIAFLAFIFYLVFRILPPIQLSQRPLWVGAVTTALLFSLGRQFMILWLASSEITSTYGSVSFMVILMVWMYFFCQLLLFGASFTYRYQKQREK
jgi:membrane protein